MKDIENFDFKNLFVLDIANNHQGDLSHGLKIINECADVMAMHAVRSVIKFQFRDLPEFIHLEERQQPTNKHTIRFISTKLSWDSFARLLREVRNRGLLGMCTPFDEQSVSKIVDLGFDLIKVASCSARDWPLLQKISESGLPIIVSTGGLNQEEIDDLVSFFIHRGCDFSLMHCVSIYPTPDELCNLGNIAAFKERYPGRVIGWSTHEPPQDTAQVALAVALGAEMFERHVGVETDKIKLNAYSSNPQQINNWIQAYKRAISLIGSKNRVTPTSEERKSIDELRRGVFVKRRTEAEKVLTLEDVYFAFPYRDGQLASGQWRDGIKTISSLDPQHPVMLNSVELPSDGVEQVLKRAIHDVKALLAYARVPLTHEFSTEYSHHYGILNFRQVGVVMINIINREYAKKILIQLPNQRHPLHYHKLKEETFLVLWGELKSSLDGRDILLRPGDTLTVPPGVWHSFRTDSGCVFEEISTTVHANDSVYRDPQINNLTAKQRKTSVDHWGRFQINEQLFDK